MIQEEERLPLTKDTLLTIIVCTGMSIFFLNTGILFMFFLVPIGYAVKATGSYFLTFVIASAMHIIINLIFNINYSGNNMSLQLFYLSFMILGYTWIVGGKNIRTAYRIIASSVVGTVILVFLMRAFDVFSFFREIANENIILSDDPAMNSFITQLITPEVLDDAINSVFRGGGLIFHFIIFFISRQIALGVYGLIKKQKSDRGLMEFFAPANTLWILLGSLAYILLFYNIIKNEILEVVAWNIFVICSIIFIAQGAGIVMNWLSKKTMGFRMAVYVLAAVILLNPIVMIALGALLLLGIAELFWRFRLKKEQVSTPEP